MFVSYSTGTCDLGDLDNLDDTVSRGDVVRLRFLFHGLRGQGDDLCAGAKHEQSYVSFLKCVSAKKYTSRTQEASCEVRLEDLLSIAESRCPADAAEGVACLTCRVCTFLLLLLAGQLEDLLQACVMNAFSIQAQDQHHSG